MIRTNLVALGLTLGVLATVGGKAYANTQDVPGQVCEKYTGSSGTMNFDTDGVRNDSTGSLLEVDCPIVLYSGTGRSLYIGGTDQNSAINFQCIAFGWDDNLSKVTMPFITITTGTYTNGTIGSFNIPDNVAKLVVYCGIPWAQSQVSKISDFWIQN